MLPKEEVVIVSRRPSISRLPLLALAFLVGVGLWSFTNGDPGQEPPSGGRPNQVSLRGLEEGAGDQPGRDPADLNDLRAAIGHTSLALERSSWDEAAANARQIKERWLSFKPAMRAQAGTRMWSTQDADAFADSLDDLEGHIASRRRDAAEKEIQTLSDIIKRYQSAHEALPDPSTRREIEPLRTE